MYTRRSSSRSIARWFIGILIVVGAVAAFVIYQSAQQIVPLPTPTQAIAGNPTISPTPAPTKPSIEYRIVSDKASLSAVIIELYFASDSDTWDLSHLGQSA